MTVNQGRRLALMVIILLIGAGLRFNGMAQMREAVLYDEAAYANDALSLWQSPRLTPYFPNNYGRESLWMYMLAPALPTIGVQPFTLRVMAAFIGILTIAAAYRLGREALPGAGGLLVAAVCAVFYWPVHLSHIGFRALLLPLIGAWAFAMLLRAWRRNRWRDWVYSGMGLGLLAYTYIAARTWFALGIALLALWVAFASGKRRGAGLALLLAFGISAPLWFYLTSNPVADARVGDVALSGSAELVGNIYEWLLAFFYQGDAYLVHNAPLRPIFDLPTGIIMVAGTIAIFNALRQRWMALLIYGLLLAGLLPSLLSDGDAHMLRALGMIVPLALIGGTGLLWLYQQGQRWRWGCGALLVTGLLIWMGATTYQDFSAFAPTFARDLAQERQLLSAIDAIAALPDDEQPVYFMPLWWTYPIVPFQAHRIAPHAYGTFDPGYCTVYPAQGSAYYVSLPPQTRFHQATLSRWADVNTLIQEDYTLFEAHPNAIMRDDTGEINFGDVVGVRILDALPQQMQQGDILQFDVRYRLLQPTESDYQVFVHLYAQALPDNGGTLATQDDHLLCEPYPTHTWRLNERIVQTSRLQLDVPDGNYVLVLGIYDGATDSRLRTQQADFAVLQSIQVVPRS